MFRQGGDKMGIESVRSMLECKYDLSNIFISDDEQEILKNIGKYNFYIYYSNKEGYNLINKNVYWVNNDEDLISVLEYYFTHKRLFTKK